MTNTATSSVRLPTPGLEHPTFEDYAGIWEFHYRHYPEPILVRVVGGTTYEGEFIAELEPVVPFRYYIEGRAYDFLYMEGASASSVHRPSESTMFYWMGRADDELDHAVRAVEDAQDRLDASRNRLATIESLLGAGDPA